MTSREDKRQGTWSVRKRTVGLALTIALLIGLLAMLAVSRLRAAGAPELEPTDLLVLTTESVDKVEAAAKAGNIQAQSALGVAYLRGSEHVPRNVTAAVYWFHRIADRDRQEFDEIRWRMRLLRETRRNALDPEKQRQLDLEYLGLVQKKLAFEIAFVGLIEIYSGMQGSAYANPVLARRSMRQGASYGFASAQRMLGTAYLFGLLGVPKNTAQGLGLLHLAAAQGDLGAEHVLREWYESRAAVPA